MIDLVAKKLAGSSGNHTWRALEEMLSFGIFQDPNICDMKTKEVILDYIFRYAKLRIKDSSVKQKFRNYLQAKSGDYSHCNQYSVDIIKSFAADSKFKKTVQELINNKWSVCSQRAGRPSVFVNHTVNVLFSEKYIKTGFPKCNAVFFERKINEYLDLIYQYVTPQHYIEHANAIGHLDKIVFVTKEEERNLGKNINNNSVEEIKDYMGLFIPSARQGDVAFSSDLQNGKIKEKETLIILCPESMSETMRCLTNRVTIDTMIDKVFSHEIGHLAFYFYAHEWKDRTDDDRCWYKTIAERQANWISSIAHGGSLDELISEISRHQPPPYHCPLLLSDNIYNNYEDRVEQLYLR